MRVAFFGGTFDPIHRGHLAIATAAADLLQLDLLLFAPTGRQPLKPSGATASFEDRLAMTTLACKADVRFAPSALDAPRADGSPNYTVDVMEALRKERPQDALFCLVGLDSFLGLSGWRQPERLLKIAEWIVVSRPGFSFDGHGIGEPGRVHAIHSIHEDVSATELRKRLLQGDLCLDLIPESVSAYIVQHHLYRQP